MPNSSSTHRGFSTFQWSLATIGVATLVVAVLLTGYSVTHRQQTQEFEDASQKLFFDVGLQVAELRSMKKSMLGMHYASDEFAGADIEAFAAQLRQYMPALRSLGMVEHVDGTMRDQYEIWMAEDGRDSFRIHEYNLEGQATSDLIKDSYLPIISVDSRDSDTQALLGTNLSSIEQIATQMPYIIRSGEAFMVPIPSGWPVPGNTLILQPAYFGVSSPTNEKDREELYAGGIWMSIDLYDLLLQKSTEGVEGSITLTVRSVDDSANVIEQSTVLDQPEGIDLGYDQITASTTLYVGESQLVLTLERQALMPKANVIATIFSALSVLTIAGLVIAFVYHWRVAQQDRLYSLRAISKERENAERTLESINDAVVSLDASLTIVYMNPSAQQFLRLKDDDVLGDSFEHHVHFATIEGDVQAFPGLARALDSLASDGRVEFDVEVSMTHLAGSTVKLTVSRMPGIDGDAGGCILVLEDVSKERKLSNELEFRANHDSLTGSYNRFYFDKRLAQLVDDVVSSGRSHALCYIDLDQFKIVNDTCGHASGDRLLCELTAALRSRLRASDVLARLGGDEFGIIICDADADAALVVANKLYAFFQNFVFEHEGKAFSVHASIGFVKINLDLCDMQKIMSAADVVCYTAKDSGRNALVVYSETDAAMSERKEEMNWLPTLKSALSDDDFFLLVQAIADIDPETAATNIAHYEFLIRLRRPNGDVITPFQFIKAAERYDLMRDIDRWVIRNAFATVARVRDRLPQDCTFSINLSGQSAADASLLPYIAEQLAIHEVEARRFWFEITETAAITHFSNAISLIKGIQAMGASVALDDFGSDLSSFGYLRQLPVDVLKIDGQFIKDIDSNDVAREMVRAMDHVGKAMKLKTVAEFVESESIVETLAAIGVDYAQGFFIAKPCPIEQALDEVHAENTNQENLRKTG